MRPIEDIVFEGAQLVYRHRRTLAHGFVQVIAVLLVALVLEACVFNINYFRTQGLNPINLSEKITLDSSVDNTSASGIGENRTFRFTESQNAVEFHGLNTEITNIHLDFDNTQAAKELTIKISFTDSAHETAFHTTEYTYGVPEVEVSTASEESQYLYLQATGYVDDLRIEITGDEVSYPVLLNSIVLNEHQPLAFNGLRFGIAFFVLLLIVVFRPHSAIYRLRIREHPRLSRACIVLVTACEIVLLSSYLFLGSNQVGVATSTYNSGSWDGHSLVNVYEVGGDNAQQYAELARAMAHGQLYLEIEPPSWLVEMDNPYDKGAREELEKQTGESYLFDVAYYEGHYYVYFGVLPVLLFYLPFYLITGANFPTAIGVLLACIAFILGITALLDRFARHHFKRVSLGLYLLVQMPLVACSGILYLAKFPTFYSLPIALALALTVWGLYFWMHGRSGGASARWYLAGSLCMALVVACRPQFVVFSLLAFPLFWRPFITQRHILTREGAKEFACLVAPYAFVAAGIMWYNKARFGSPFDFGANYNLTVNDMTQRGMNAGRLAPALFAYFLQTPTTTGVFPWIQPTTFETTYLGQTIKEVTFGGIFACLPVLWLLAFAKPVLTYRFKVRSTNTIAGVVVVMLVSGVIVACLDAQMAGILQRYTADYSTLFLMPCALLAFIANDALAPSSGEKAQEDSARDALDAQGISARLFVSRSRVHKVFLNLLLVAVLASLLYSTLVCFVPETGWYSDVYGWAYQDIVEMVEFWS